MRDEVWVEAHGALFIIKVKVTGSKPLKEPECVALMPALALALGASLQGARPVLGLPGDSSGACEDFYSTY